MATINGSGRADVLRGANGNDWIYGGDGDDRIDGLAGNDLLFGGAGRDTLNGGSGSDVVDGGMGDDLLIYSMGENRGAYDIYNGGFGRDTLRLQFTAAEWDRADVRADVHRFLAFLPEYNEPLGWTDDPVFAFKSFGLALVGINKLEVLVDGKAIDATDRAVTAAADTLALSEDDAAGATVDLLANDLAPDGVRSVRIAQPRNGAVELVSTDFGAAAPSAVLRFKPDSDFDHLKAGETATEVFTYTVVDKDGDEKTASVTVTITGKNDRPEVTAATAAMAADSVLTGGLAVNARDVDGDKLSFGYDRWTAPAGFEMKSDGTWTFDPHARNLWNESEARAVDQLKAGETRTYEVKFYAFDPSYSYSANSTLTITVTGVNDAAVLQNTRDHVYEDFASDWTVADGVHSATGLLNVLDWDADYGDATITVVGADAGNIGTLTLTGFDEEEGRYGYRFDADSLALAAVEEGEERVQTFQLRIDDGQGSITTQSFEIVIVGDGNDPVEVPDWPLFGGDVVDANGVRTVTYQISFDDGDYDDVHTATVAWADPDALGDISAEVMTDEDGDRYLAVSYQVPLSQVDALDADYLEQTFRVSLTDNAGSSVDFERTVQIHNETWQIGDAANDLIYGGDDALNRDVMVGGEGADQLIGGDGRDWLYGDAGPDLPAGRDNVYEWWPQEWTPVEGFNDELDGGAGADLLTGGEGADRFVFRRGEADGDVITDFSAADGDRITLSGWDEGSTVARLDATRWQVASADGLSAEVITLANGADLTEADFAFEYRAVEWRIGGEGDDYLSTPEGEVRHVIIGGGGRDYLYGDAYADELYGDEGPALPADKENLFDGSSNWPWGDFDDELNGYSGADLLVGGAGADLFIFGEGQANGDVVRDFDAAEGDRLDFSDWGWGATFTQLDATHWEIADEYRYTVEVITFENAPTITPDDYFFF